MLERRKTLTTLHYFHKTDKSYFRYNSNLFNIIYHHVLIMVLLLILCSAGDKILNSKKLITYKLTL